MKKKLLEKIPIAKQKLNKKRKTYSLYSHVEDISGEKVLVIDCYYSMNDELTYRLFLTKTDYITLDINYTDSKRWKTGGIDSVLGYRYVYGSSREEVRTGNKDSENIINEFFKAAELEYQGTVVNKILRHQEYIRRQRLVQRDKKITDPIDKRMAQVPDLPENFTKWIEEEALYKSRYLFYEYSRKRTTNGCCSHCKSRVEVTGAKHNEKGLCPNCQSEITYKSLNKQKSIYDAVNPIIIQKVNDMLLIREFRAYRHFRKTTDLQHPFSADDSYWETNRAFFDLDGYQKDKYYWGDFKQRGNRWNTSSYVSNEAGVLYSNNLDEILINTRYQYSGLKKMAESHHGYEFRVVSFIEAYPTEKYFEYLIKYNLCNILKDLLRINSYQAYYSNCYRNYTGNSRGKIINAEGQNIAELLKIQKYDLTYLQTTDANLTGLKFLQYCRNNGIKPVKEMIEYIQENFNSNLDEITYFTKYTTIHKAIKYINTIKKAGGNNKRAGLWKDYLDMCIQLKYDLKNDFVLFPRDLKLRHDQCVSVINEKKNAKELKEANKNNREIKKMYSELTSKYTFENDKLMIVVPKEAGDIIREGHNLHHCVGTYVKRVSSKETIILFIRKKQEPEVSHYTMEVKNGKVTQVRGKNNANMTPDVQGFVESFKAKKLSTKLIKEAV